MFSFLRNKHKEKEMNFSTAEKKSDSHHKEKKKK